jgi:hypothetical protein
MRRFKLVVGLVGASMLLVGLVVGALLGGGFSAQASAHGNAFATATPTPMAAGDGKYCQLFEQTLANNLHVSKSHLDMATQAALRTTIDQARKDGQITDAQHTALMNDVNQLDAHPCTTLGRIAQQHARKASAALVGAHQAVLSAVATKLGLSPATLQSDLDSGKTVQQIAAAQHVSISDVNTAYLDAVRTQLNTAVGNGMLTKQQSSQSYSKIEQAVAMGHYPLLEGHGMQP